MGKGNGDVLAIPATRTAFIFAIFGPTRQENNQIMINPFKTLRTVKEVKSLYRELAMKHHPDRGGDTATMQEVNRFYHEALKRCDRQQEMGTDGREHTYHYNENVEQSIMDKISEILALRLDGVDVWLVGSWVWLQGNTRPHREALKAIECLWHGQRQMWYWKPYAGKTRYNKNASFGDLAATYGARIFHQEAPQRESLKS